MKLKTMLFAIAFSTTVLTGCGCKHEKWYEADCTTPKTCVSCGFTKGEPLGHLWEDANCKQPKTCKECGDTEGSVTEHNWIDATCSEPTKCSICGDTQGSAIGHNYDGIYCNNCGEAIKNSSGTSIEKVIDLTDELFEELGNEMKSLGMGEVLSYGMVGNQYVVEIYDGITYFMYSSGEEFKASDSFQTYASLSENAFTDLGFNDIDVKVIIYSYGLGGIDSVFVEFVNGELVTDFTEYIELYNNTPEIFY